MVFAKDLRAQATMENIFKDVDCWAITRVLLGAKRYLLNAQGITADDKEHHGKQQLSAFISYESTATSANIGEVIVIEGKHQLL